MDRRCDGSHSLHVQDIAGNMRITVQAAPDGGGLTAKLRFLRGEPLCMTTLCITQRTCPGRDYLVREGEDGVEIKPDLHLGIGCNARPLYSSLQKDKPPAMDPAWCFIGINIGLDFLRCLYILSPLPTRCLLGLKQDLSLPQPTRHQCWAKVPSIANCHFFDLNPTALPL